MKALTAFVVTLVLVSADVAAAQTDTIVLLRTATGDGIYHYAEVIEQRGRWVFADVGYIDFDHPGGYREVFFGAGGDLVHTSRLTVTEEGLLNRSGGEFGGDLFLMPYTSVLYRVSKNVTSEAVYLPYFPLTSGGRVQHLLERAKAEYDFPHLKVGGGYAAYRAGDEPWQHKPFVAVTLKAGRFGDLELWLQRLPGDHATVQIRYGNVFH